jgi:hypothetical protein
LALALNGGRRADRRQGQFQSGTAEARLIVPGRCGFRSAMPAHRHGVLHDAG